MYFHHERGPDGFLQIGPSPEGRTLAWLTIWRSGVNIALPGERLLCLRSASSRPLYSERHGIGVRRLLGFAGWRLLLRSPL